MAVVKHSVLINRPVDDVFQYVAGFENYPSWNRSILECKRNNTEPTGIGAVFYSKNNQ